MTWYGLSGLLAGISSTALALLVLWKSSESKIARMWLLFSISVAVYSFCVVWFSACNDAETTLTIWRWMYGAGVIWIAPLFYQFVRTFLNLKQNVLSYLNHGIAFFFATTTLTPLFFEKVEYVFGEFFYGRAGTLFPYYLAWWMGLVFISHVTLYKAFKSTTSFKKVQIQYFFLATAVGFIGGSLSYLPILGIDLYPWGNFSVMLYPIIMAYAMLKYQLMDVGVLIRRAGLVVAVYSCLLLIVIPLLIIVHPKTVQGGQVSLTLLGFEVLLLSGILSLGPTLYAYFVRRSSYFHEHSMAGLTHELKSPLAMIENAVTMLSTSSQMKLTAEDQASYISMIERNTTRLKGFVNELLHIYRLQDKSSSLETRSVDVMVMCRQIISERSELAQQKGVRLSLESDLKTLQISCDADKIQQVLSNLISNALKFTRCGKIELSVIPARDNITVKVTDTGSGIPAQELPYVFDRFFQSSNNKSNQGSGIGLTIAKAWVEAHGGKIWAESEGEGKGTTVTFTLPKG